MPSLRFHHKSRHGCLQCKQKKVKCDGSRPLCQRCSKNGLPCSLELCASKIVRQPRKQPVLLVKQPLQPTVSPVEPSLRKTENEKTIAPSQDGALLFTPEDLRWYHYFVINTASTLGFRESATMVWTRDVPIFASQSPCLLYCICALAVLHKLSTDPIASDREAYISAATSYQSRALTLYVPVLQRANVDNATVVVCFNLVFEVLPYAWRTCTGFSTSSKTEIIHCPPSTAIDAFLETLKYWQGMTAISTQFWPLIQAGPTMSFFIIPDRDDLNPLSANVQKVFDCLLAKIEGEPRERRNLFEREMTRLHHSLRCSMQEQWRAYMWSYVTEISSDVVQLLKTRDPFALAILSGWAFCLRALREKWWTRGWPEALSSEISKELGREWDSILSWGDAGNNDGDG